MTWRVSPRSPGGEVEQSEATHQELARWLSGVNTFISAVNRPASLRELLDLVTATACDLLGYDFCGVLLVRPEQRRLMMEGAHGLSREYVDQLNDQVPITLTSDSPYESPSTRAFLTARPVVVNDVTTDPMMEPWRMLAERQGYRAIVSVPLLLKGRPFGVLNCYSAQASGIGGASVELLTILANQVAAAIEAIHLRDEQRAYIDDLAQANESLRRQSFLLQQAEEVHKRLTDVALGGQGLDSICGTLSELIGHEVFIDDLHGHRLAPGSASESVFPSIPDDATGLDVTAAERDADATPSLTVLPVRIADETVARMWIDAPPESLSDLDRRALESAAVIVALEMLRTRTAQDVEWRVQGDVVHVLLNGHRSEFPGLVARARPLGHDLEAPHVVIALSFQHAAQADPLASSASTRSLKQTVHTTLGRAGLRPLLARDDRRVMMLLADDAVTRESLSEQLTLLQRAFRRHQGLTMLAVVGPTCSRPEDYPRAARILRGAATLLARQRPAGGVVALADLGILSLLLQIDQPEELSAFATRTLGPLRAYDASRGGALEETLRAYFSHGCSANDAASELFVHPNTVKMRIRKVESILGTDLTDTERALSIRSALLIEDVVTAREPGE